MSSLSPESRQIAQDITNITRSEQTQKNIGEGKSLAEKQKLLETEENLLLKQLEVNKEKGPSTQSIRLVQVRQELENVSSKIQEFKKMTSDISNNISRASESLKKHMGNNDFIEEMKGNKALAMQVRAFCDKIGYKEGTETMKKILQIHMPTIKGDTETDIKGQIETIKDLRQQRGTLTTNLRNIERRQASDDEKKPIQKSLEVVEAKIEDEQKKLLDLVSTHSKSLAFLEKPENLETAVSVFKYCYDQKGSNKEGFAKSASIIKTHLDSTKSEILELEGKIAQTKDPSEERDKFTSEIRDKIEQYKTIRADITPDYILRLGGRAGSAATSPQEKEKLKEELQGEIKKFEKLGNFNFLNTKALAEKYK